MDYSFNYSCIDGILGYFHIQSTHIITRVCEKFYGNIAAQVESRWDAVSSLIGATKKYSSHEAETLTNITAMRSKVDKTSEPSAVEKDDSLFEKAMNQLNVVVENYPELKADSVYIQTMEGINRYENNVRQVRIQAPLHQALVEGEAVPSVAEEEAPSAA